MDHIIEDSTTSNQDIISLFTELSANINKANRSKGFWNNPIKDKLYNLMDHIDTKNLSGDEADSFLTNLADQVEEIITLLEEKLPEGRSKGEELALIHSEISEALEGLRKNQMSDKIPEFSAEEEELADAMVRIFDYSGGHNLRIGEAFVTKLLYNRGRAYLHGKKF